jgi:hypothetical protein
MNLSAHLRWLARTIAAGTMLIAGTAWAGTCKLQNPSAKGSYKFVRVHDADTGKIVLSKAINGGDIVDLEVSGSRVRIEAKTAGQKNYRSGPIWVCKAGNTLRA